MPVVCCRCFSPLPPADPAFSWGSLYHSTPPPFVCGIEEQQPRHARPLSTHTHTDTHTHTLPFRSRPCLTRALGQATEREQRILDHRGSSHRVEILGLRRKLAEVSAAQAEERAPAATPPHRQAQREAGVVASSPDQLRRNSGREDQLPPHQFDRVEANLDRLGERARSGFQETFDICSRALAKGRPTTRQLLHDRDSTAVAAAAAARINVFGRGRQRRELAARTTSRQAAAQTHEQQKTVAPVPPTVSRRAAIVRNDTSLPESTVVGVSSPETQLVLGTSRSSPPKKRAFDAKGMIPWACF